MNLIMMHINNHFDLFVSTKSGTLKALNIEKTGCKIENISTTKNKIDVISWMDENEKEILIGQNSDGHEKSIVIYDTEKSSFTRSITCNDDTGSFKDITCYNDAVLTASANGHIKIWTYENNAELLIEAGDNLNKMAHSKNNKNIVATGGKENKLKLFDLEKKMKIFEEKNLPHDWLEMRIPLWISDIGFLEDGSQIATCSRYGHVRMYDPRTQRRPVTKLEFQNQALMKLAVAPRDKCIIVGSGRGNMNLVDLRNPGRILNTYKDFVGSITGIVCTKTHPFIISTSLDRYLRIHHLDNKKLLYKTYLTSRLSSMIVRSDISFDIDILDSEKQSKLGIVKASKKNISVFNEGVSADSNERFERNCSTSNNEHVVHIPKRKKSLHDGQKKMKLK